MTGTTISGQYDLIKTLKKLSMLKNEYENVEDAFTAVRMKGYGVVSPTKEEIILDEPEIIRQGNKYGVRNQACLKFSPDTYFVTVHSYSYIPSG